MKKLFIFIFLLSVYIEDIKKDAAANKNGEFSISGLKPGKFTAIISYTGYLTNTESIYAEI